LLSVDIVDGRFLAVGSVDGDVHSVGESIDGLSWQTLARRPFDGDLPWSIASFEDRLIVIAGRPFEDGSQTAVWGSPDGAA
jgi:hypothetical protein